VPCPIAGLVRLIEPLCGGAVQRAQRFPETLLVVNSRKQCVLEFATFDWSDYRLWAGIRRRADLNFLNELENDRAFDRLPNGFKKLFLPASLWPLTND
jgi:hypothetical protein